MTRSDLVPVLSLLALLVGLVWVASKLYAEPDWKESVTRTHATLFIRMGESILRLLRHAHRLVTGPDRSQHAEEGFVAIVFLVVLCVPPILAGRWADGSHFATHGVALVMGTILWSALAEMPGVVHRRPDLAPMPKPLPLVVLVPIVIALDVAVSVVTLGNLIHGGAVAGFFFGAACVALADVVSAALGLVAAALKL